MIGSGAPDSGFANAPSRFAVPAMVRDRALPVTAFHEWWEERVTADNSEVTQIPFAELENWYFDRQNGNLAHDSGRFFTVEGLKVRNQDIGWSQPIINQPETGILGILVKEFDGVLHCLMQAKMEPGNINTLQLSPTVQATHSNYTRVHRGSSTRYLEYFRDPGAGRTLVDVFRSEYGTWFWRKRNRNMVVHVIEDVPEHENFYWLTVNQIWQLLSTENLVNMDVRTVLSCIPPTCAQDTLASPDDLFTSALLRSYGPDQDGTESLHTRDEILRWFTENKARCQWRPQLVPLSEVTTWTRTSDDLVDLERQRFRIIAVRVQSDNREVTRWTQPMLSPCLQGHVAFLARPIHGVLHLLVQARPEPGLLDRVEMAPTVQLPSASGTSPGPSSTAEPFA
ncbi:MAG TPA: NDP-hexose 2,3-dehydratase family protein, partial [Streptosporangiaceae bacterium]